VLVSKSYLSNHAKLTVVLVRDVLSVVERKGEQYKHRARTYPNDTKLYIGEACWAFLFGVIIGPSYTILCNGDSAK
jgi:hypothetical protein